MDRAFPMDNSLIMVLLIESLFAADFGGADYSMIAFGYGIRTKMREVIFSDPNGQDQDLGVGILSPPYEKRMFFLFFKTQIFFVFVRAGFLEAVSVVLPGLC